MGNEMWVIVVLEAEWAIRRCGGGQKQNNEIIVPLSHITSSTSVFFQPPAPSDFAWSWRTWVQNYLKEFLCPGLPPATLVV